MFEFLKAKAARLFGAPPEGYGVRPPATPREHLHAAWVAAGGPAQLGEEYASFVERHGADALDLVNARTIHYYWLRQLGQLTNEFKIDLVIDGGANTGQYASTLLGFSGYRGEVHSYEPLSEEFAVMKQYESHYGGWRMFNMAIGDFDGEAEIVINGEVSSLLQKTEMLDRLTGGAKPERKEKVAVRRLDTLYCEVLADLSRRVMLKLDVQGFEERALRSAGKYLGAFKLVQIELSGVALYNGDMRIPRAMSLLEDAGFTLIYCKNNFSIRGTVTVDFDFIFCRRSEFDAMQA
ncbi:FkbM family methyltransferase [Rhodoplanes sp. SY1]|uniref:FkbM family methyltransferase n=1 Tax=Rhodoplanes sp. SY1 TaxID=3166646 RepID=UPI0038B5A4F1